LTEQLARVFALLLATADDIATCLRLARSRLVFDLERFERHAKLRRECLRRFRWLAVFEGGGLGRTDDLFIEIGLLRRNARHVHGEAARGTERADLSV